jgi:hypothetical protein
VAVIPDNSAGLKAEIALIPADYAEGSEAEPVFIVEAKMKIPRSKHRGMNPACESNIRILNRPREKKYICEPE